jgi:vacuolar-type H+-ATPase subunit H
MDSYTNKIDSKINADALKQLYAYSGNNYAIYPLIATDFTYLKVGGGDATPVPLKDIEEIYTKICRGADATTKEFSGLEEKLKDAQSTAAKDGLYTKVNPKAVQKYIDSFKHLGEKISSKSNELMVNGGADYKDMNSAYGRDAALNMSKFYKRLTKIIGETVSVYSRFINFRTSTLSAISTALSNMKDEIDNLPKGGNTTPKKPKAAKAKTQETEEEEEPGKYDDEEYYDSMYDAMKGRTTHGTVANQMDPSKWNGSTKTTSQGNYHPYVKQKPKTSEGEKAQRMRNQQVSTDEIMDRFADPDNY